LQLLPTEFPLSAPPLGLGAPLAVEAALGEPPALAEGSGKPPDDAVARGADTAPVDDGSTEKLGDAGTAPVAEGSTEELGDAGTTPVVDAGSTTPAEDAGSPPPPPMRHGSRVPRAPGRCQRRDGVAPDSRCVFLYIT
jgi:hypothetical protein